MPLYVAAIVANAMSGDGEHRPLWRGVATLAAILLFLAAARASALRDGARRAGRPMWGPQAFVHRVVRFGRWPLALLIGAGAAWFAQWHHDVPWFSALSGAVVFVAAAAALAPVPPYAVRGPTDNPSPDASTTTVSPSRT